MRLRHVASRRAVDSDPLQLTRILRNFVQNALAHARARRILLGVRLAGGDLRLCVVDDGCGIADEDQESLFTEFARGRLAARQATAGLGLGLPIARLLAQALGHEIGFDTRAGRGTCFWVRVPVARQGAPMPAAAAPAGARPMRILLIEDAPDAAEAVTMQLAQWGHRVTVAATPDEALARAAAPGGLPPDLVIADFRLGGGATGVAAVALLRARRRRR